MVIHERKIKKVKCALCLEDRKLSNSHIVPDFIFKRLQGPNREFHILYTDEREKETYYKTFAEKLLCSKCENLFSVWEDYASQFFYGGTPLTGKMHGNVLVLEDVDYTQMKLFLMSILWRFGVTTIPWFKGMKLGPHEERLRSLLNQSDPSEANVYGCNIAAVLHNRKHFEDLIIPPTAITDNGHRCQRIVVGGYIFQYFVSTHEVVHDSSIGMLQKSGRLFIAFLEMRDIPFLHHMNMRLANKAQKRL